MKPLTKWKIIRLLRDAARDYDIFDFKVEWPITRITHGYTGEIRIVISGTKKRGREIAAPLQGSEV